MSNHVSEWLNAYYDGELRGSRLRQVEEHLVDCELCQKELESLDQLSSVLHEVPASELIPPERFTAQVNLRLPHKRASGSRTRMLEVGWWMIPVGLLTAWVFISTSFVVSDILAAANNFGLLSGISGWTTSAANAADWSATLGRFGLLSGNGLQWSEAVEAFARTTLPEITLQVSIALLYLSWIAIWWVRHQRQGPGQLLGG